jgi:predicted ATPase
MRLIERESQLAALSEYLEEIRAGSGAVALVPGEAGAGKSALVSAFLAEVADRVAAGSCDGLSAPRPLGPVIEIAAQLEVDTALPRDELFTAILATLTEQPTIVLVEDLHWIDDATADFLLYLGRRLGSVPAMLVGTYRDDEMRSNVPLTRLVGELTRLGVARRVAACSLTESGVASMVAGSGLDPVEGYLSRLRATHSSLPNVWQLDRASPGRYAMSCSPGQRGCRHRVAACWTSLLSWASGSIRTC